MIEGNAARNAGNVKSMIPQRMFTTAETHTQPYAEAFPVLRSWR